MRIVAKRPAHIEKITINDYLAPAATATKLGQVIPTGCGRTRYKKTILTSSSEIL